LGISLLVTAYALYLFTVIDPIYPTVVVGISFALTPPALFGYVPFTCSTSQMGTAFALMYSVQSAQQALLNWLFGYLRVQSSSYKVVLMVEGCLACCALICCLVLVRLKQMDELHPNNDGKPENVEDYKNDSVVSNLQQNGFSM